MFNETDYLVSERYNRIAHQFTKYVGILLYVVSLSGTIMNVLTFLQDKYRNRACILYLLMASIFDFAHLNLGSLSNILQYGFHYDWTIQTLIYCQIKSYFAYVFFIISGTLTILANVDRYMLSSHKSTRWSYSRRHIGVRYIKLTIFFWFVLSIPIIFCSQRSVHVSDNDQLSCSSSSEHVSCYLVQLIHVCLLNGVLPPFIMMLFGFLTHRNILHSQLRTKSKSIRVHRLNQQLTAMLILQSIKSTVASIPYSIFNCYWLITIRYHKSLVVQAKENLIHQMCYLLFWSNYTSFFVYIYSSDIFRDQWIKALKKRIFCLNEKKQRRQQNSDRS